MDCNGADKAQSCRQLSTHTQKEKLKWQTVANHHQRRLGHIDYDDAVYPPETGKPRKHKSNTNNCPVTVADEGNNLKYDTDTESETDTLDNQRLLHLDSSADNRSQ